MVQVNVSGSLLDLILKCTSISYSMVFPERHRTQLWLLILISDIQFMQYTYRFGVCTVLLKGKRRKNKVPIHTCTPVYASTCSGHLSATNTATSISILIPHPVCNQRALTVSLTSNLTLTSQLWVARELLHCECTITPESLASLCQVAHKWECSWSSYLHGQTFTRVKEDENNLGFGYPTVSYDRDAFCEYRES